MYKLCERCHFHVPAKNALCNVCGSQSFSDLNASAGHTNIDQTLAALAASSKTVSADVHEQLGTLSNRIGNAVADYGRDLLECGAKMKSAAVKMKNLIVMPGVTSVPAAVPVAVTADGYIEQTDYSHHSNHDDVLSFHKNINFGRRARAVQNIQAQVESQVQSMISLEPSLRAIKNTDDSKQSTPALTPSFTPTFTPMIVKPLDPDEFENALKADVEVLKHNLDELKEWFENYGKADPLLRTKATQLQFSDRERNAA